MCATVCAPPAGSTQNLLAAALVCALAATTAPAQTARAQQVETTGEPGSPSATTTVTGKQLPAPDSKFGGVIKDGALQSKYWWAPRIVPPKQAPTHRRLNRSRTTAQPRKAATNGSRRPTDVSLRSRDHGHQKGVA